MTNSFFGALLALPCIVNSCGKISLSSISNSSGQPAYPTEKNPCAGKSLGSLYLSSQTRAHTLPSQTAPSVWKHWTHTQAEEIAPPTVSCAAWGELNTLTHTHNEAIWPHTIHLHSDTGLTKANKRYTFFKYYSPVRDCSHLVWDSWNKGWLKFHQEEQDRRECNNNGALIACVSQFSVEPLELLQNTYSMGAPTNEPAAAI